MAVCTICSNGKCLGTWYVTSMYRGARRFKSANGWRFDWRMPDVISYPNRTLALLASKGGGRAYWVAYCKSR